jgi:hypothetical protein
MPMHGQRWRDHALSRCNALLAKLQPVHRGNLASYNFVYMRFDFIRRDVTVCLERMTNLRGIRLTHSITVKNITSGVILS